MNINHRLITLGLALGLLGGASAFARPTPHFENGFLSQKKRTITETCSDGKNIRCARLCASSVG
jgi:hypothetical protein